MQPLSRLSNLPSPLPRNKKLDTALSLTLNDPSDSSLSTDTTVHIHRAPLAQIDQQNFPPTPPDLSPLSRAPPDSIPPTRALGKPIMPRRSSYTGEDSFYAAGTSSQSSSYRRLSQYVFHFFFSLESFCHLPCPSNLNSCREEISVLSE